MAEGPIYIILEMLTTLIEHTVETVLTLLGLSGSLLSSLSLVLNVGGGLGLFIVLVVLGAAGFFVVKFLLGSMKSVAMLILGVLAIMAFLFIGAALV